MLDAVHHVTPAETMIWVVYRENSTPIHVGDRLSRQMAPGAVDTFMSSTYVLNPTYVAYHKGLRTGVHRLAEIAPKVTERSAPVADLRIRTAAEEEAGYVTVGWPKNRTEIAIATNLPDGGMSELTIIRDRRTGGFSQDDLDRLTLIEPLISSVFCKHWDQIAPELSENLTPQRLASALDLTQREAEVCDLILQGHSSLSIAHILKISITTVKTHRRNIYAKLSISSQAELFSLTMRHALPQGSARPN